jgi:hypothetical protein
MKTQPIFSENFLSHYISDFRLSNIPYIREIGLSIGGLINELESGKFNSLKEEEIKSRFVTTFFGNVLGFNYGNSNEWLLSEEKKAKTSGKKVDAALGFFKKNKSLDDVRAVIEIKDANTELDEKQKNRKGSQSPVEQAFTYAQDMGGYCKWVIVSNIKEIRFYPSLDKSKCQVFFLKDLKIENGEKIRELLFLFHKDNFIKNNEIERSSTDKLFELTKLIKPEEDLPIHIIDKLFKCLERFEGLRFVDPNYVATLYPFNILDEYVWHYKNGNLFTLNEDIFKLLSGLNIENNEIKFVGNYQLEITNSKVIDAVYKVKWIFEFLNNCLIDEISAVNKYEKIVIKKSSTMGFNHKHPFYFNKNEGITKNIKIFSNSNCDCVSCNFRNLDFNRLLKKLKVAIGNDDLNNFEYAYGNYLVATNNYKASYNIYKSIEKECKVNQGGSIKYFIAKLNIKFLYNLIRDYELEDRKQILTNIKSIDLDKVIYDEIEFNVDRDVKKYLIDLKEEKLIFQLQDKIEKLLSEVEKLKHLYDNGGRQYSGSNLPNELIQNHFMLYLHINSNFLIYDTFWRYKTLTEKTFKGLLISYQTPEFGLKKFNDFILTEAILHISPSNLQDCLENYDQLEASNECIAGILNKLHNLLSSYINVGRFSISVNDLFSEQLINWNFKYRFRNILGNLFSVLRRLNIDEEKFIEIKKSLLQFLKIENELAWPEISEISYFIRKKGNLFLVNELVELIKISIDNEKYGYNKYDEFLRQIPYTIIDFYPEYKFDNEQLIKKSILNCYSEEGNNADFMCLVSLANICDAKCKTLLYDAFEDYLDKRFNETFYEELLRKTNYDYNRKKYFQKYLEYKNLHKRSENYEFLNFVIIVHKRHIDVKRSEFKIFTDLTDFETWLLNPYDFDYRKFEVSWLLNIYDTIIIEELKEIQQIACIIEKELHENYNPILSEIKYKYFKYQ